MVPWWESISLWVCHAGLGDLGCPKRSHTCTQYRICPELPMDADHLDSNKQPYDIRWTWHLLKAVLWLSSDNEFECHRGLPHVTWTSMSAAPDSSVHLYLILKAASIHSAEQVRLCWEENNIQVMEWMQSSIRAVIWKKVSDTGLPLSIFF